MTTTPKTFKQLSLDDLERAFGEALTKLVGEECKVVLDEMKIDTSPAALFASTQRASISGRIEVIKASDSDTVPF
jgi:hypothetical protein